MHPELLNNPTFLRYHEIWQRDPKSIVFAPLADFFCQYKLYADARKVCEAGVKHNPNSILAHYSLAKAYLCTREWHSARHEAQWVIARVSKHQGALDVLHQVDRHQVPVRHMIVQPSAPAQDAAPAPMDTIAKVMEQSGGSSFPVSAGSKLDESLRSPMDPADAPTAEKKTAAKPVPWQTVTMAKIYSQQGLYFKARTIYRTILSRDPQNAEARAGLATLERKMRDAAA